MLFWAVLHYGLGKRRLAEKSDLAFTAVSFPRALRSPMFAEFFFKQEDIDPH